MKKDRPRRYGVRLRVAYDGTGFSGFAKQPDRRTVQGVLEDAVEPMAGHRAVVRGASRTDAGVHALGQVVAFDSLREIEPYGWVRGLNATLPDDVSAVDASDCTANYQPRFDADWKRYRYLLEIGVAPDPLLRHRAWHIGPKLAHEGLDMAAMVHAAKHMEGTHDFKAFRASDDHRENTERTLTKVELRQVQAAIATQVQIEVTGTAFMKQMVRILVGTLVEVGRGAMPPELVAELLSSKRDRRFAGPTAPAHGLTLMHIELGRSS